MIAAASCPVLSPDLPEATATVPVARVAPLDPGEWDCELHARPYRSGCAQCGIIPLYELYPPSGAQPHSR